MIIIKKLLIISFDAVCDNELDRLMQYESFSAFARQAEIYRRVSTVFLSNTYPVHTSVVTGVNPAIHSITSNTEPFPCKHPVWKTDEREIRAKTLWQAASEKDIKTAAVLWPVTAHAKTIPYNIPEVLARPGKNQLLTSLAAGSKFLQIKMFLRHCKLLDGIRQPGLDYFSTACMTDILREYAPGLALLHLTAYDTLCHQYGKDSQKLDTAFQSLVQNLKTLENAAGHDYDIILFSDHGQLNVHTNIEPNLLLEDLGLLKRIGNFYEPGDSGCFIECCGGSAFFHSGNLKPEKTEEVKIAVARSDGFSRFLSDDEMSECGHQKDAFGFCSKEGYCYEAFKSFEKANHGYPLDMPDYKVFYMARGKGFISGKINEGGNLLDIAPLAAKRLGLDLN